MRLVTLLAANEERLALMKTLTWIAPPLGEIA